MDLVIESVHDAEVLIFKKNLKGLSYKIFKKRPSKFQKTDGKEK